ncbi:MAG TPA: HAMP domain-containing sensor histidine kinase [Terriglobales bacterium]|jgi:signal transduction histidine kinase|nr:HAMP domain-containing sensor histidine kinase [Terriglobales bacterium]
MRITSRRKATITFLVLGVGLAGVAVAVGFGWIILNWREGIKVFLGVIFFGAITAGLVLNTIFLLREIRRNEQHDSFINAVTHELKTPIASIRLYLQTLQHREVDETQRREFYRRMLDDTDRLLGTVEQVLKAGVAGHRKSSRERVAVDFASLVQECVEVARTGHHLQTQALRIDPSSERGMTVTGDPEELRTALANLLDNAIKYSGDHVDVSIRIETPDEKHVRLSVQDHGVGIPPAELKSVFKRFYRVSNRSLAHVKGTGLGLFIVRAIAKKHGGRAFAQSQGEGHGTTVVLELPRDISVNGQRDIAQESPAVDKAVLEKRA